LAGRPAFKAIKIKLRLDKKTGIVVEMQDKFKKLRESKL